jgi:hypothetical protein
MSIQFAARAATMDGESPSGGGAVMFKVKPNAFLYAIEATRNRKMLLLA